MQVTVDEPRHEEAAVEVRDLGRRTDERRDARIAAGVHDPAIADGNRFRDGIQGVGSEDGGIAVDAIGRSVRGNARGEE